MLRNLSARDAACLLLRLSLGVIFIVHGCAKIGYNAGTSWEPEFPAALNALVAWGELVGGVAMLLGLLTRVTAGCFGVVMACAIYMIGSIKGFEGNPDHYIKHFDYMRVGAEFPFALLLQCAALLLMGGGALSADSYLRRVRPAKGAPLAVGAPHMDVVQAPAETSPR